MFTLFTSLLLALTFQILPQPQSVEVLSGKGIDYSDLTHIQLAEGLDKETLPDLIKSLLPPVTVGIPI